MSWGHSPPLLPPPSPPPQADDSLVTNPNADPAAQEHAEAMARSLGLRVVAVTAYAMQGDRDKAIAAGFDDYVTKPINAVQFRKYVEDLLRT